MFDARFTEPESAGTTSMQRVSFTNPDINYLTRRAGLRPRSVARWLRIFGEPVVLEALRRMDPETPELIGFRICRKVERDGQA